MALLKLSWYSSSSRDGDEGGDECDELHFVGRREIEVEVEVEVEIEVGNELTG